MLQAAIEHSSALSRLQWAVWALLLWSSPLIRYKASLLMERWSNCASKRKAEWEVKGPLMELPDVGIFHDGCLELGARAVMSRKGQGLLHPALYCLVFSATDLLCCTISHIWHWALLLPYWNLICRPLPNTHIPCKLNAGVTVLTITHLFHPWEFREITELLAARWKPLRVHPGQLLIFLERELMIKTQLMTMSPVTFSSYLSHTFPLYVFFPILNILLKISPLPFGLHCWPVCCINLLGSLFTCYLCSSDKFHNQTLQTAPEISGFHTSPTLPINTSLTKSQMSV